MPFITSSAVAPAFSPFLPLEEEVSAMNVLSRLSRFTPLPPTPSNAITPISL